MSLQVLQPTISVAFLAVWALVGGILIRGNRESVRERRAASARG